MTKKIVILFLFLNILPFLRGQAEVPLKFDFYDPSLKLYAIGESHFENDGDLQIALLKYITSKTNVDAFVIELSGEVGLIFNEYVLYGSREKEINVIYSLLDPKVASKFKSNIEFVKNYNKHNTQKIKIVGIDKYHFFKLKRQMKGLNTIFPETAKVNLPLVQKYIVRQEVKDFNTRKSAALVTSLINEIKQNETEYRKHMGNRLDTYFSYLSDLEFQYLNQYASGFRKLDSLRENTLSKNLINTLDSTNVCLMICGAFHAMFKMGDDYYYGYPMNSMTAVAKEKYADKVFSIIMHYYDKMRQEDNLLNQPLREYIKSNAEKYVIINQEEVQNHQWAKERASMVIIQNKRYKSKKDKSGR